MEVKEHLVSLKVMRLLKPSMYSCLPIYTEPEHFSDNLSKLLLDQAFKTASFSELNVSKNSSLTDFLVIPQIFGNLYIGETFTSYICLHNQSQFRVKQLSIKVELQTTSQKIGLRFKSQVEGLEDFEPDQTFDGIVEHDVKELGSHILICIVSYLNEKSEKLSFKKFYKFVVSKPFEIQPKYPMLDIQSSDQSFILFQAQIQNVTNSYLLMENVKLHPLKEGVKIEEIDSSKKATFKSLNSCAILKPSEIKQYLFKINYENIVKEKGPLQVGKLDISWRYSLGENGHLQTHPLEQPTELNSLYLKDVDLRIDNLPSKCFVDESVSFTCNIKNQSDRTLDLYMKLSNGEKANGFIWNCNLTCDIANLAPKDTFSIQLSILPVQTGLITISGISIMDLFLKRLNEFDNIKGLFVLPKMN